MSLTTSTRQSTTPEPPSTAAASQGPSDLWLIQALADATLINEGIAISRDTLQQLETHLPLVHTEGDLGQNFEYFDEQIGRRLIIRYAGDAKFKGVRSSFPVYEVIFDAQ